MTTKKKSKGTAARSGDPALEFPLDYSKARLNPFAGQISDDRVLVLLDVDVSKVFTSSEAVNTVLRALVNAMPTVKKRSTRVQ